MSSFQALQTKRIKSIDQLREFIKTGQSKIIFHGAQTSTVMAFDQIEKILPLSDQTILVDVSQLPKKIKRISDGLYEIQGPVSWQEAQDFMSDYNEELQVYPTEKKAHIISGAATSCTGERSFRYQNFRSQIKEIRYIDYQGEKKVLSADKDLSLKNAQSYHDLLIDFKDFKNPPFPRFEKEIDLMVQTEGQLGMITSLTMTAVTKKERSLLFIPLPAWEKDDSLHLKIFEFMQDKRNYTNMVEFIDHNSFSFLAKEDRPTEDGKDALFIEVDTDHFEELFEALICEIPQLDPESIFEMNPSRFEKIRVGIPHAVSELNARNKAIKKGTDVQVQLNSSSFEKLFKLYRKFSKLNVTYNLFGHFGDAHLHFNFLAKSHEIEKVEKALDDFYQEVKNMKATPFAEHGLGIIKKKYITKYFLKKEHQQFFQDVKKIHDPQNNFFPQGFMSW